MRRQSLVKKCTPASRAAAKTAAKVGQCELTLSNPR